MIRESRTKLVLLLVAAEWVALLVPMRGVLISYIDDNIICSDLSLS
jgi:hypothetical protein